MSEEPDNTDKQAQLFTLRLWSVDQGADQPQWRSRLQNVRSGEVFFCDDLPSLMTRIEEALDEIHLDAGSS